MNFFSRAVRAITQITQNIFTTPHQNWLDVNGKPLAGGRLFAYAAGTTTPATTWQDAALTIVNTNPVVLDAGGFSTIWLDPNQIYNFRMTDNLGVQQWTVDNYQAGSLTANILVPLNYLLPATGTNVIDNGSNDQNWNWSLTGTNGVAGFAISENAPSTNTNPNSALMAVATRAGSTVSPFGATAHNGAGGLQVTTNGDIVAVGVATYIGPVRIPSLINQPVLGTDPLGNIVVGTGGGGGGGGGGILSINGNSNPAQTIVAGSGVTVVSSNGVTTISLAAAAPTLGGVSLSPASVQGGNNSTGTVTLTAVAPTGGSVVTLTSSNTSAAQVPASVTVPAGQTAATFTVTTSAVVSNTTVTITGNYVGSHTANLTVTAPVVQTPIYGGLGAASDATGVTMSGGNVVLVPYTGDVLNLLQNIAETVGQSFGPFTPTAQSIYLLLTGSSRTFVDQNGNTFAMNPPIQVTLNGQTKYLYASSNQLYLTWTIKVAS